MEITIYTLNEQALSNKFTLRIWDDRTIQIARESKKLVLLEEWPGQFDLKARVENVNGHVYYLPEMEYAFVRTFYHRDTLNAKDLINFKSI